MKVEQIRTDKFTYYLFNEIFDDHQLKLISDEMSVLYHGKNFFEPMGTGTAFYENTHIPKKNNMGIFLDHYYANREESNYFKFYKDPLNELSRFRPSDYTLNLYYNTKRDYTLVSYYDDNDYYEEHIDGCCYSYIFWLTQTPKNFTGGNLWLNDINHQIEVKNNTAILFPAWATHSVERIKMLPSTKPFSGLGRYAFATFFGI